MTGPLTSGMVGLPVTIEYDEAWDGLTKNLVCRCSPWGSDDGEVRTILNVGETAVVAHEVMQAGQYLHLGIEGFREDGTLVMPTTWARCGRIEYGANADGDPSADPALPIWGQLQAQKVCLPVDTNGDPMYGEAGQYAVSDGAGGIKWVSTAPDTGGDSGGSDSGGDTGGSGDAAISEVLDVWRGKISGWPAFTPIEGSGDCKITGSMAWFDTGNYFAVAFPGAISGGHVAIDWNTDMLEQMILYVIATKTPASPDVTALDYVGVSLEASDRGLQGSGNGVSGSLSMTQKQAGPSSIYISGPVEFDMPAGYYPWLWFRRDLSAAVAPGDSNAAVTQWIINNVTITVTGVGQAAAVTETLTVDDDYAQDYGVAPLSIVTNASAGAAEDTGLDVAYASSIEEAKNAWMVEANGNVDKIPLIIHTDQHGNFSQPMWDTVDKMVDWYEISKVVNLGDTVSAWSDADTAHPLTKCAYLEDYLDSTAAVPWSKRIEVFGNHDTWATIDGVTTGLTPQNYLRKYFKNIYARGTDNYGNMVVCDDHYNVKYLVISGMAYDSAIGGYSHYIIPSASWDWIIAQLEMADGYDVVVMSHVALGSGGATITDPTGENNVTTCGNVDWVSRADLWAARKNKTGGSFTDQYGVSHAYDFSRCNSEILCGLHGHEHADGYYYVGNALLDVFFDAYYLSPKAIHFVLIDRESRQLNVWKVDNSPQVQNYQIPLDAPTE